MAGTKWEYFVLQQKENSYGESVFTKADGAEVAKAKPVDTVLNVFGSHGYELVSVQTTRIGATKFFFKRPKAG